MNNFIQWFNNKFILIQNKFVSVVNEYFPEINMMFSTSKNIYKNAKQHLDSIDKIKINFSNMNRSKKQNIMIHDNITIIGNMTMTHFFMTNFGCSNAGIEILFFSFILIVHNFIFFNPNYALDFIMLRWNLGVVLAEKLEKIFSNDYLDSILKIFHILHEYLQITSVIGIVDYFLEIPLVIKIPFIRYGKLVLLSISMTCFFIEHSVCDIPKSIKNQKAIVLYLNSPDETMEQWFQKPSQEYLDKHNMSKNDFIIKTRLWECA